MQGEHSTKDDLLRSERELLDFFENANVPLHWVGPDGTVLRANAAELDLLGYDSDEYVGRHISEFHVDGPVIDDILDRLGRGEKLSEYPARMRHKDGSIRHVRINSSVLFEEGEFVHTRCVTLDVTEQKRAEAELEKSEERYRRLTELLPVAVYTCEAPTGLISYFNTAATRLWGRVPQKGDTDERFCGSARMSLPDGTTLAHEDSPMAVALREGRSFRNEDVVLARPDGSRIPVLVNIDPIRDDSGKILGAVNVFHDVSELKEAQRALRDQKENLETLLDTLPIAVVIAHDSEGRRISGNRAAAEILRTAEGANLSKTAPTEERPSHFEAVHRGEPVLPKDLPIQRAARGEVVESEEIDHVFDDGTTVHALVSAQPLYDPTGQPRGAVASILDVTELKVAESALKETDRRKDEFLAVLAHELRNPLAPIRNALQIMSKAEGDGELLEDARQMMERQLQHLVRLVDDLLDVSRITHDKLELRREQVEIRSVIDQAIETCRPFLVEDEHDLDVELPSEPVFLRADPVRLSQVFGNLIHNACKYTESPGQIRIRAERRDDVVIVSVQDNGIGLPPEVLPHLFEGFNQVVRTNERAHGGLGIGLTLVKRLVEMHGGSVEAFSEGLGRGSEFVVRLPVLLEAEEASPSEPAVAEEASSSRRVLVVDDNRDSATSLALLLEMAGNETYVAHDGPEASETAEKLRPDVLLLDIGLPEMDGYDVCRAIRSQPWGEDMVIVAVTGWGQDDDRRKSREAGFDGHLVKPLDYEDVLPFLAMDRLEGARR